MDCRTASLLIEAYHDDELALVDAAHLLAHFEECPGCRCRCDEAARLRDTVRTGRPVDRCPQALAKRLARSMDAPSRFPRRPPRLVVLALAGGCGLLVGWSAGRFVPRMVRGSAAFAGASRTFDADVFCLRCALRSLLPPGAADSGPHVPVLRSTSDGRIWVVNPSSARARFGAPPGPAPRHVVVTAVLDERTGVADVTDVSDIPAVKAAAAPAPGAR